MKALVLALGASSNRLPDSYDISIGCNDAWRVMPTDYLVSLDPPYNFPQERLDYIKKATCPLYTINRFQSWEEHHGNVKMFDLRFWMPPMRVDRKSIFCSNNTAFTAMTLAYTLGATEIILAGADFTKHKVLGQQSHLRKVIEDFQTWAEKAECDVYVTHKISALSNIFPVYA